MAVIDDPAGNAGAQIGTPEAKRAHKPYPWSCSNPECDSFGVVRTGYVEDGCDTCGAGRDATQGSPLPATDYNCRACRGGGTVERKCGTCAGTGFDPAAPPAEAGAAQAGCPKCGGAGTVAIDCARCEGRGIDPEPQVVERKEEPVVEQPKGMAAIVADGGQLKPGTLRLDRTLPSIDDETAPLAPAQANVVRYRLIRYYGAPEAVAETIQLSLHGTVRPGVVALTAIEIAPPRSAALQRALEDADAGEPHWPVKDRIFP